MCLEEEEDDGEPTPALDSMVGMATYRACDDTIFVLGALVGLGYVQLRRWQQLDVDGGQRGKHSHMRKHTPRALKHEQ